MMFKLLHLLQYFNAITIIFIARDLIFIFKHAINYIDNECVYRNIQRSTRYYRLLNNLRFIFPKIYHSYSNDVKPNISLSFEKIFKNSEFYFTTQKRLDILRQYNKIKNIECLELKDINEENTFDTFTRLAKRYDFTPSNDPIPFQRRVNRNQGDSIYLLVILYAHPYDLMNSSIEDNTSFVLKGDVNIIITTHQIHPKKMNL
ncbi:hypothetical protein EJ651_01730 [Campylobacter coli]|nr:hypothetical protein [Campylobacter coli]